MHFAKKLIVIAIICGIFYAFLGFHYIVVDKSVKILKKSTLTLKYTFYSTKGKSVQKILSIPELWEDGIGDLLVSAGKISEDALQMYKDKLEEEKLSY